MCNWKSFSSLAHVDAVCKGTLLQLLEAGNPALAASIVQAIEARQEASPVAGNERVHATSTATQFSATSSGKKRPAEDDADQGVDSAKRPKPQ